MKVLPWRREPEAEPAPATEDRGYTDIVTQALVDAAADNVADAYVSALEIAAGQLSRAFASASITGAGAAAFDPWVLAQIGRQLIEGGEAVWFRLGQRLMRAETWELNRGAYTLAIQGRLQQAPSDRVLHVRWNVDPATLRGIGPLMQARQLRVLMQRMETALADEQNAATGYLLPVPADGDADNVAKLKDDLQALRGRIAIIETARAGWGTDATSGASSEYRLARLGPNVPDGNVRLYSVARDAVLAACGYPVQLSQDSDGTAQREAWRRYLHGTVGPLGRLLATDAARVGLAITVEFDQLFASDIMGRARAFQSLVGAGMSLSEAAAASGILTPSED